VRSAAERLEQHYVSNARLTAEILLAQGLSVEREYLYAHDDRVLTPEELQLLEDRIYDRISGVPLQYIVGRQEFYGRYFHVNPSVLIPRPETEYIVEAVLELQTTMDQSSQPRSIVDVGTGSGCLAVTLALELPGAHVLATDISFDALRVAQENSRSLQARVQFACMDVLDAISGEFDFIVSNPPYVRRDEMTYLQREVREHEPHVALFSPDDELAIYRRLVTGGEKMLKSGGCILMEVGIGRDEKVLSLFSGRWQKLATKADLQGIPRTVIARWQPNLTGNEDNQVN
jgi:release factor glutamine methyltransferase